MFVPPVARPLHAMIATRTGMGNTSAGNVNMPGLGSHGVIAYGT